MVCAEPSVFEAPESIPRMSWSILRFITLTVDICMMRRPSPWLAKMLNSVRCGLSCHSTRVAGTWVRLSTRGGILPFNPRVTAVAPPEPATRNIAWLPLITASVVQTLRSHDWPCSNWAMNSCRSGV